MNDITLCFNVCTSSNLNKLLFELITFGIDGLMNRNLTDFHIYMIGILQQMLCDNNLLELIEEGLKGKQESEYHNTIKDIVIAHINKTILGTANKLSPRHRAHLFRLGLLLAFRPRYKYCDIYYKDYIFEYLDDIILNPNMASLDLYYCYKYILELKEKYETVNFHDEKKSRYETWYNFIMEIVRILLIIDEEYNGKIHPIRSKPMKEKDIKIIFGIDIYKTPDIPRSFCVELYKIIEDFVKFNGLDLNKVTILYSSENLKGSVMRNAMIQIAKSGTYLIFNDDDDARCGLHELCVYLDKVIEQHPNYKIFKLTFIRVCDCDHDKFNSDDLFTKIPKDIPSMCALCMDRDFLMDNCIFNPPHLMNGEDGLTHKFMELLKRPNEIVNVKTIETRTNLLSYLYLIGSNRYEKLKPDSDLGLYFVYSLLAIDRYKTTDKPTSKYHRDIVKKIKNEHMNDPKCFEDLYKYETYNKFFIVEGTKPGFETIYLFNFYRKDRKAKLDKKTGRIRYTETFDTKEEWDDFAKSNVYRNGKIKFLGGNIPRWVMFLVFSICILLVIITAIITSIRLYNCSKVQKAKSY